MVRSDEYYMDQALNEAQKAFDADEVPIGSVIVMQDRIIARGYNQVETLNDCTAHAEMIALTSAFSFLGSKYLPEATLYVTMEPCTMCAGALNWSKMAKVVFGASDEKHGGLSLYPERNLLHPKTELIGGIRKEECASLVKEFFRKKR